MTGEKGLPWAGCWNLEGRSSPEAEGNPLKISPRSADTYQGGHLPRVVQLNQKVDERVRAVIWQPIPVRDVLRQYGWKDRRRYLAALGWIAACALCILSQRIDIDQTVNIPSLGWHLSLSIYLPTLVSQALMFLLGPGWALPAAFLASMDGLLSQGVPQTASLLISLVDPLSVGVLAVVYRGMALPVDFRSCRSWGGFAAVAGISGFVVSSGSFIWSEANLLGSHDTLMTWLGWMFGSFVGSMFLVAPLMALILAPWYKFRGRILPVPAWRGSSFRLLIATIAGAGLTLAAFLAASSKLATERLEVVLRHDLQPDVREAVWDAVASWRFSAWSGIGIVVVITVTAVLIAYWWSGVWERQNRVLAQASHRAQDALRVKSTFLATISHELRTPMNGILGMHELLLAGELSQEQRSYVSIAEQSARHLLNLLNELLDLSKIEAGKLEIRDAPFDVREQVEFAVGLLRPKAQAGGLALRVFISPEVPPYIMGDADRFRQILLNLVGNSVKFTGEGSVDVEVEVVPGGRKGPMLSVSVIDTGPGIPPEVLPKLFQPFAQGEISLVRKYGGTGLGLSICKQLTERMGGAIEVESFLGEGATFRFRLPLRVAEHTAEQEPARQEPRNIPSKAESLRAHVLLAEDNPVNQLVAQRFLERLGCTVTIAGNGQEAIDQCQRTGFDVVLMDCQMPDIDGLEATRRIRNSEGENARRLPIVAMTAHSEDAWRERCREAGMDDFLCKPVAFDELRKTLLRCLGSANVIA